MRRAADFGFANIFAVAAQAAADDFARFEEREARDLRLISHPLDVEITRPVTALAAGFFRR